MCCRRADHRPPGTCEPFFGNGSSRSCQPAGLVTGPRCGSARSSRRAPLRSRGRQGMVQPRSGPWRGRLRRRRSQLYATRDAGRGNPRLHRAARAPRVRGDDEREAVVARSCAGTDRLPTARHDLVSATTSCTCRLHASAHGRSTTGRCATKPTKPRSRRPVPPVPGLCLTVNEIICSGDRLALALTEHGPGPARGRPRGLGRGRQL